MPVTPQQLRRTLTCDDYHPICLVRYQLGADVRTRQGRLEAAQRAGQLWRTDLKQWLAINKEVWRRRRAERRFWPPQHRDQHIFLSSAAIHNLTFIVFPPGRTVPFPQQHPRLARAWLACRGVGEVEARGVGEVEAVGAAALAVVSVEGSNPLLTEPEPAACAAAGLCRCRSWWYQVL